MDKRHEDMLNRIRKDAVRAFGKDGANAWMNRKWRVFNNHSPVEMAGSRSGANEVLNHIALLTAAEMTSKRAGIAESEH